MSKHFKLYKKSLRKFISRQRGTFRSLSKGMTSPENYFYGSSSTELVRFNDRSYQCTLLDCQENLTRLIARLDLSDDVTEVREIALLVGYFSMDQKLHWNI